MSDAITILRAHGRRLAKVIHDDGTIDNFDKAKTFDLTEVSIDDLDAALRLHAGSPGMPTPDALSMGFAFIRPCYGGTPCHATTRPHLFAPLQEVSEQHGHGGDAHSRHITN